MSLLDEVLTHNNRFVSERQGKINRSPAKKVVVFTCMDTRLVDFLEPAMGIRRGDATVIKNAGTAVLDPNGGVIRSLAVAIYALGCEEVFVIGHLDCGMADLNVDRIERAMLSRGVPADSIRALKPELGEWLGGFQDVNANVRRVTRLLRDNPLIPSDVPVHGLMFDPARGSIESLDAGYAKADTANIDDHSVLPKGGGVRVGRSQH
jgi:carbonic anhydrase